MHGRRHPGLRRLLACAAAALAAVATLTTPPLQARVRHRSPVDRVIADCAADGQLDGRYALKLLVRVRRQLPPDVREYTDCDAALRTAIRQARRHRSRRPRFAG